jgi:uncharacterized lipoprotein YddW (UPF0748 family)
MIKCTLLTLVVSATCFPCVGVGADDPPPLRREFRAAWVATVANIDWPSKPGLSTDEQKEEMLALLDDAVRMNLNAIILQVRPACDAIYESKLEPWSEFLTGKMGKAPEPYYDPLTFAIEEAHKRGIELHAWFNPYRTRSTGNEKPAADNHVSKTHPQIVKKYGDYHWMDPGEPKAFEHTMAVIRDVVERYDIDGVHMDDYFYPYPVDVEKKEGDKTVKEEVPFPDDPSWEKAQQAGVTMSRDDWRRDNINRLVKQINDDVHKIKPWIKFGVSPFGIGRPGKPPQIKGFDQYESLYADTEKWFKQGWVDYLTPQLYWRIGPPQQSYGALLHWWHAQNKAKRHLWPGNFTSRLLEGDRKDKQWETDEVIAQIWVTRAQKGASGNVHFSMKALSRNARDIADQLIVGPYREPALIPESPWLAGSEDTKPEVPKVTVKKSGGQWTVTRNGDNPWLWVVKTRYAGGWNSRVVPGAVETCELSFLPNGATPEMVAVSTVNRVGTEGTAKVVDFRARNNRE